MKDTSGRNCTAIWSFFSQTSFIEKNSPLALRGFTNFLFLFSLFFPPFSSGHERWSSTGDFIRIPRTRRFFAWIHSTGGEDISVMKCKSQEMERKYQLWLTIPASPLDVLKTIQRYKFIFVISTRLIKLSCFFFLHFRGDKIDERNCYFLPFLFSFLCFPFVEIMRILNLKRFREILRNL